MCKIYIKQLQVTKIQHLFYELHGIPNLPKKIIIQPPHDTMLIDQNNEVLAYIYRNILPNNSLDILTQLAPQVTNLMQIPHKAADKTFVLGHYLSRNGTICQSTNNTTPIGQQIISALQSISSITEQLILLHDRKFYSFTQNLPSQYRLFNLLSVFYCNLIPPANVHRDEKDAKWCFIFPFGTLPQTGLNLYYCNTYITLNVTDIVMLKSRKVWHVAEQTVPTNYTRYSGVLTTSSGLIKKFM